MTTPTLTMTMPFAERQPRAATTIVIATLPNDSVPAHALTSRHARRTRRIRARLRRLKRARGNA